MNFVDTSISCEPVVEIHTDQLKRIDYWKKSLIQIGISLAAIFLLIILIVAFIYLFTRKQLLPIDNNIRTTITIQNYSTTTTTATTG